MASALDPVPMREKKSPSLARGFARALHKKSASPATFEEYKEMVADRPVKFDGAQVNYHEADGEERCATCFHFFIGAVAGRNVCEIMRPVPEKSIDPEYVCDFVTTNGTNFPLLEGKTKSAAKKGESDETTRA
jgi:hypothetical protein